jgi:TPR repeat protein
MNEMVRDRCFSERSAGFEMGSSRTGDATKQEWFAARGRRRQHSPGRFALWLGTMAVAVFCLSGLAAGARAQGEASGKSSAGQVAVAPEGICISADLISQISMAARRVLVVPAEASTLQGARTGRAANPLSDLRSRESVEAYRAFEASARHGDVAARVNLAIAALAGWDGRPNAGAALYWLNEAARQGYSLAYFDLGILYQTGCAVRQDYAEAARYFALGAAVGHAPSQMNLGYLYDQGLGVTRDRTQAAGWYRKAAEAGLAQAQFNLADLYARGEGAQRDESAAFVWFEKAAQQGHATAQLMLAAMYEQGRGTVKDLPTAYAWLTVASQRGDARAQQRLTALAAQLNPAQIALARAAAAELAEASKRAAETAALR